MRLDVREQREALEQRGAFTSMTDDPTATWPRRMTALLVGRVDEEDEERHVLEFGLANRSAIPVATGWHRLSYIRRRELEPLPISQIAEAVPRRFRRNVERLAFWGGVLPPMTAEAVMKAIEILRPRDARLLVKLRDADPSVSVRLRGDALQAAAQEADAVRLALDIADIPRRELRDARPTGDQPFIEVLSELRVPEDAAIVYDNTRFLDFDRSDSPAGVVRFTKGDERLTVINVNRQPLERTTGADLIYLNETLESFVLVQYKTLRREAAAPNRLIYRPDKQLREELERMRAIEASEDDGSVFGFRLHAGCCFLKFCRPVVSLNFPTRELVTGMYLPIELYDVVVRSDEVKGPRDGIVLGYDTVRRYVNNDLFVSLVRGAWVGSCGVTSDRLSELVLDSLSADRSVTVATASSARDS